MATSIGGDSGGRVDIRRLLTSPWVLGGAALFVVIAVVMWKRTGSSQTPAATGQLQPATTQAAQAADQFGLATTGLQQQLSDLVAQWSAGIASLQHPPAAGGNGTTPTSTANEPHFVNTIHPIKYIAYPNAEMGRAGEAAGVPEFFSPSPGVFLPFKPGTPGFSQPTPIYFQDPSTV